MGLTDQQPEVSGQPIQGSLFQDARVTRAAPEADAQELNFLGLCRIRGLGLVSLSTLLRRYGDLSRVWEEDASTLEYILRGAGVRSAAEVATRIHASSKTALADAALDRERLRSQGTSLLFAGMQHFPPQLELSHHAPAWLFVQGNVDILSSPDLVAVVGTRSASSEGKARARDISMLLADLGMGIVSGLAHGIDEIAHQTALDLGVPTIGVLGTGLSIVFPASTAHLRRQMVHQGGAVVTEYLPNDSYSRARFVQRNRIQVGLSRAVVPVEGAAASGTAHTYRFARESNLRIFGVTRGDAGKDSEIVGVMRHDGVPIVALDDPHAEERVAGILQLGASPRVQKRDLFAGILDELRRIFESYPVDDTQIDEFTRQIRERWNERKR